MLKYFMLALIAAVTATKSAHNPAESLAQTHSQAKAHTHN